PLYLQLCRNTSYEKYLSQEIYV
ncbi:uncharacterized protein METZ01_LOCUS170500, partial [marine metagenome]